MLSYFLVKEIKIYDIESITSQICLRYRRYQNSRRKALARWSCGALLRFDSPLAATRDKKLRQFANQRITEARNASHTASTNAPRPAETKGANSRRQRVKSVPHEFRSPAPSVMVVVVVVTASATIVYFLHCGSPLRFSSARYSRNEGVRGLKSRLFSQKKDGA